MTRANVRINHCKRRYALTLERHLPIPDIPLRIAEEVMGEYGKETIGVGTAHLSAEAGEIL